jgi:hypothetical protein
MTSQPGPRPGKSFGFDCRRSHAEQPAAFKALPSKKGGGACINREETQRRTDVQCVRDVLCRKVSVVEEPGEIAATVTFIPAHRSERQALLEKGKTEGPLAIRCAELHLAGQQLLYELGE